MMHAASRRCGLTGIFSSGSGGAILKILKAEIVFWLDTRNYLAFPGMRQMICQAVQNGAESEST